MSWVDPLVGRNLRLVREVAKVSRRELAAAAGISQSAIEKIEIAYVQPTPATVQALAKALGVTASYLGQDLALSPPVKRPQDVGLAKVIRAAREASGMDREKLARRAGIRPAFLMDIEAGRRLPSSATRRALARALHLSTAKLAAAAAKRQRFPIGAVIRELRVRVGLDRPEVAAAVGISGCHLATIERGAALPSAEAIEGIANVLGADPADLRAHLDGPVHHRAWGGRGRRPARTDGVQKPRSASAKRSKEQEG